MGTAKRKGASSRAKTRQQLPTPNTGPRGKRGKRGERPATYAASVAPSAAAPVADPHKAAQAYRDAMDVGPDYDGSTPLPNARRERFAIELLACGVQTQAAKRAGYAAASASVEGTRLLGNASVRKRVDYLRAERAKRVLVDADRVLHEAAILATSNMADFLAPQDGVPMGLWPLKPWEDIDPAAMPAIQEVVDVETASGTRRRGLKLHPKAPFVALLADHLGLKPQRHEHSGPGGGAIPITAMRTPDDVLKDVASLLAQAEAGKPPLAK